MNTMFLYLQLCDASDTSYAKSAEFCMVESTTCGSNMSHNKRSLTAHFHVVAPTCAYDASIAPAMCHLSVSATPVDFGRTLYANVITAPGREVVVGASCFQHYVCICPF